MKEQDYCLAGDIVRLMMVKHLLAETLPSTKELRDLRLELLRSVTTWLTHEHYAVRLEVEP